MEEYINIEKILKNTEELLILIKKRTAVWIGIGEEPYEEWECDNCGNIITTFLQDELEEHKYCHKCGAKMVLPWADMKGEDESIPQGKWIDYNEDGYVECPYCHAATNCDDNIEELNYCWSCGAKLEADTRGKE